MSHRREPPKVASISPFGEELDEHGNEILRIEPMPAPPPPVFPDFLAGLAERDAALAAMNPPTPTQQPRPEPRPEPQTKAVTAPEQPTPADPAKPDTETPGAIYQGKDTRRHSARFDYLKFRRATPEELEKLRVEKLGGGLRNKYPFATMEVGEEFLITDAVRRSYVAAAASEYGKRNGKVFTVRATPGGNYACIRLE